MPVAVAPVEPVATGQGLIEIVLGGATVRIAPDADAALLEVALRPS